MCLWADLTGTPHRRFTTVSIVKGFVQQRLNRLQRFAAERKQQPKL
jgi:hypothetical protein